MNVFCAVLQKARNAGIWNELESMYRKGKVRGEIKKIVKKEEIGKKVQKRRRSTENIAPVAVRSCL